MLVGCYGGCGLTMIVKDEFFGNPVYCARCLEVHAPLTTLPVQSQSAGGKPRCIDPYSAEETRDEDFAF